MSEGRAEVAGQPTRQHYLLYLFWIAVLLQAAVSVAAYLLYDVPVSTEIDSVEYIRTADNVVAGHGFSIEDTAPWKPNAFRTPGPLLTNIPLRILSFKSDLLAIIISRLLLLVAAVLVIHLASRLGLSSFALVAGTFFVLAPSMIGLVAMYALYLRPAALFVLAAYIVVAIFLALRNISQVRRRLLLAAGSCLLGVIGAYGTWGYRNYKVFGAFQYSSISGEALLRYNVFPMEPYLDEKGKQEVECALVKYGTFLQRYSDSDQFILSNRHAKEALRLIFKYPLPFLQSHLEGVIRAFFVFSPNILKGRSPMLVIAASIVHSGLAIMGILGLAAYWKTFSELQRLALLLMLTVGVVSSLTVGAPASPRFRIPFDVVLAIGCALFVMRALRKRDNM